MNDQQFLERAHANPHDDSPELQEAAAGNPDRQQLLDALKLHDAVVREGLEAVSAPGHLKQALLDIPNSEPSPENAATEPAANDSFWRRNYLQYAASFVVAIGALTLVFQGQANPMEDMVFAHIYSEMPFLDDTAILTLDDVNAVMASRTGTSFNNSAEMQNLEIHVSEDCWVDIENGVQGVHIVMQGNSGPVTVMVIPASQSVDEMDIADERFTGLISPTPGGYLVVVGEKNEEVREYSTMLAGNMNW